MRLLFATVSLAVLLSTQAARACGDDREIGHWVLDQKAYSSSYALPFLSPGNDSRINLQLLMRDVGSAGAPTADQAKGQPGDTGLDASMLFANFNIDNVLTSDGLGADNPSGAGIPPSVFSTEEGTRCVSSASGQQAFVAALQAEQGLSANERTLLSDARGRMNPDCSATASVAWQDPLAGVAQPSAAAQDFAAYLKGASAFYEGKFDEALASFTKLAGTQNVWLRESASYMIGRTLLNKAEVGAFDSLDGVPQPKVTDKEALAGSQNAFKAYLAAYPTGRYATSARGLMRRLDWLAGDKDGLSSEYGWQIANTGKDLANLLPGDLSQEIDAKYFAGTQDAGHDANLLAVADLMKLRQGDSAQGKLSAADLDAQASDFAGHEALFAFLKAARLYYAAGDAAAALQLLGDARNDPPAPPYVAFSRSMLRGQALMALGQYEKAADYWTALLPQASGRWQKESVELGLALSWEKAGTLNKVFLPGTRIADPGIRATVLRRSAGPILLRQAVADPQSTPQERALARFVLLFKEATRGHYTGFLEDFNAATLTGDDGTAPAGTKSAIFKWAGTSQPYSCPALKAVMAELAANPRSAHGLLCLGDFVRTSDLDDVESFEVQSGELGSKPIFPGAPFSRGEVYRKLIADASTPDNERAYALYRAINCYGPSGNNRCGGQDVGKPVRKAWFNTLKTKYGATSWARSQSLYW
ncbi:hypothetical protein GCM10007874_07790 [Labrys miyagiensis]|uniref:Outer membrane assembly lipoprotein YfiO n=1 Tax=Labrys miyagiensis TaxID=346912 RepID=A0ABQ6CD81_9HYPH|nr:hypothetical protein [Labrys miyagiensis]GLS17764.1 hypothetical protein GCM10007874_07790 [Labrys miyagiensis]